MIDSTPLRAWTSGRGRGSACWWGFGCEPSHRGVLGRAHTTRYERSLRPCAARFATAQDPQAVESIIYVRTCRLRSSPHLGYQVVDSCATFLYLYAIASTDDIREGRRLGALNRRELLGAGALAIATAACGGSTGSGGSAPSIASSALQKKQIENQLLFYNWAQYHDPKNAKEFSKKYGVAFKESNYTSNEELLTKLQTTKGQKVYDIIV